MLTISGIDPEHVQLYGDRFLKLIRSTHQNYASMMGDDYRPFDPNHHNVIDISSDEEYQAEEDVNDEDGEDWQEETSSYFQQSQDVRAFNDRSK